MDNSYMCEALRLARESVEAGGGPFGAVIVRGGEIVGRGSNRVTHDNDPTAHAEIRAIRDACRRLGDYRLTGCELYVTCMPCPMCFGAAYWARLERIYFAASAQDAADIGFDDLFIARELMAPAEARELPTVQMLRDKALEIFERWRHHPLRVDY